MTLNEPVWVIVAEDGEVITGDDFAGAREYLTGYLDRMQKSNPRRYAKCRVVRVKLVSCEEDEK